MQSFNAVLSSEDVAYIGLLPEVQAAKSRLDHSTQVSFTIELTDSLRSSLTSRFGLDFASVSRIPMRWIKGDTLPHVDIGQTSFENTYLVYLNDCPGEFTIGENTFPIHANTGFVFNEGTSHRTLNTGVEPRLLIGPMNELAQPVGAPLSYYPTEADALAFTNALGYSGSFTVGDGGPFGPGGGYTHWRLASNSYGTSSQLVVYANGSVLNADGGYYLYPAIPCLLEGTKILCYIDGVEKYVPIETMRNGTIVKTSMNGYKKIVAIGKGTIDNPANNERTENRLYKCSPAQYKELNEDLFLTGCHSILEFPITEKQKEDSIKHLNKLYVTEKKYRLMACVDERAEPWNSEGTYTIYHFALENEDDGMNYGVYANGGLLVETCAIRTLMKRTNMKLI